MEKCECKSNASSAPVQADDELDLPYLAGFEWDKEESWTRLIVHLQKDAGQPAGGKKKKKGGDE